MKNIFQSEVTQEFIERLDRLTADTQPAWGKMNAAQMLAHCNVTYEMIFEDKHPTAKGFKRFLLKKFVKPTVVGEKDYKRHSPTAPAFLIKGEKDFEHEKSRLIDFMKRIQAMGSDAFEGRESNSFGNLTSVEWNIMFVKHLEHHYRQFGI